MLLNGRKESNIRFMVSLSIFNKVEGDCFQAILTNGLAIGSVLNELYTHHKKKV